MNALQLRGVHASEQDGDDAAAAAADDDDEGPEPMGNSSESLALDQGQAEDL